MIAAALASLAFAAAPAVCTPPRTALLLLVETRDPSLRTRSPAIERALRVRAAERLPLLPPEATRRALTVEGGQKERARSFHEAEVLIARAGERFEDLDDEAALGILAEASALLTEAEPHPGAIEALARAHLLAGAIYLARDRLDAARRRIQRALDLDPDLVAPPHRFSPRLFAEIAAMRMSQERRPAGRLAITSDPVAGAEVFLDGRAAGRTPIVLEVVGAGRHLVRVSAAGHKSHVSTVEVAPGGEETIRARLTQDPELREIGRLPQILASGEDPTSVLSLLAERAGAEGVLLADVILGPELSDSGTATVALTLLATGLGRGFAATLSPSAIGEALDAVLACRSAHPGITRAPAILGLAPLRGASTEVPKEPPVWERVWFWAAFAAAGVGLAGGLALGRAADGPPEAVRVTLIPRP